MRSLLFLLCILFFSCPSSLLAQEAGKNSCIACHEEIWDEVKPSIHGQNGISCEKCHGGDPAKEDSTAAKAPETGFIGIPDKKKIAQVCGECHANVEVMNAYGTRTDQLAQYKTSHHGKKLLLEGDSRVAVCSDCHSYHDVVSVTDPSSPVYPSNLPNTCNRCHGNEKIMSHYNLPTDIFEKYKKSVHGHALFEKKDISVATCASCHGSHGAVPPGVKDVGATCGKCHVNEKKYFLESVHTKIAEEGKFSECISCHGFHGVEKPTVDLYEKACITCHDAGSTAFQKGRRISEMLGRSVEDLKTTESLVRQAAIEGIFVEDDMASLEEAKSNVIALAPLQHTLSPEKITPIYDQAEETLGAVKENITVKRKNLQWRKLALVPIWIFIFVMSIALWLKYKQLESK